MNQNILISGTFTQLDGTWVLNTEGRSIAITAPFDIDPGLANQIVSMVGVMGAAEDTPGGGGTFTAERIVSHAVIAARAFEIGQSGPGATAEANWYLAEKELLGLRAGGIWTVVGRVQGAGGAGLTVQAFDRNVGAEDTLLGQVTTDPEGNYAIGYFPAQLGGKPNGDLVIKVSRDGVALQTSEVLFNAGALVEKDFVLPATVAPEFDRLVEQVRPVLRGGLAIGGLGRDQLAFLKQKTGLEGQKLEWLATSHALAGADSSLANFYYALQTQNLPTDPAAVLARPRASVELALQRAVLGNQVAPLPAADLDRILTTTLPQLRAANLLNPAAAGQPASLGDLLRTMPQALPDDSQAKVADLVAQNGVQYAQLSGQLGSAGLTPAQAIGIERTLRLADLTLNHPPLMQHLQQQTAADPDGSLRSLTALSRAQWLSLASTYGVPTGLNLTPEAYARQLERAVDTLHPTAMLAARINSGDLVLQRPGFENTGVFLNNNADFDILHSNLPAYASTANFQGVDNQDRLMKSLSKLQRVKRMSTSWDEAGALLNAGLESALDVVGAGPTRFGQSLAGQVTPERAAWLYERARTIHDTSLVIMSGLLPRFSPAPIAALGNATRLPDASATTSSTTSPDATTYPTLQSLFGPQDAVVCDQSVLSPAAYLVDLLQFLNPRVAPGANSRGEKAGPVAGEQRDPTALEALLARRPDLADLELTSANTDIELPYIDLVLEILENAVGLPFPLGRAPVAAGAASPELAAALQATSLGRIGNDLTVSQETDAQRQLTRDANQTVIVSDDQRRWSLYSGQDATLGIQFPDATSAVYLPIADEADLASQLDANQVSPALRDQLDSLLPAGTRGNPCLFVVAVSASPGALPSTWTTKLILGVTITLDSIDPPQPAPVPPGPQPQSHPSLRPLWEIQLEKPSGEPVGDALSLGPTFVQRFRDNLNKGQLDDSLKAWFPLAPENYSIRPVQGDSGIWTLQLVQPVQATVTYSPANLVVRALAYQTVGQSDDLIACPANQNPLAYAVLRNPAAKGKAVFPWSLPFNLPWETVRACLNRAGVTRRQLMELSQPENYVFDSGWAYETLGLSPEEAALIAVDLTDQLPVVYLDWGLTPLGGSHYSVYDAEAGISYPPDDPNAPDPSDQGYAPILLSIVSILLQQARISFEDLLSVLKTYYVGGSTAFNLVPLDPNNSDRGPCNLCIQVPTRTWPNAGLTDGELDRMHRFIRLWRRLGWTIAEVDLAINAFDGEGEITQGLLVSLANIQRLQESLGLPVAALLSWWADLLAPAPGGGPTTYEQVFLNPRIQSPPDEALLLNAKKTDLLTPNQFSFSDKVKPTAAALGMRQDDFRTALNCLDLDGANITLDNLSALYRVAGLARALGLSMQDYQYAVSLTGMSPLDNPQATVTFCRHVQFIQQSGFTLQELAFVLTPDYTAAQLLNLAGDQMQQWARAISSAMQAKLKSLDGLIRSIITSSPGGPTVSPLLTGVDAVTADAASLSIGFAPGDSAGSVTRDFALPVTGQNGTSISWAFDLAQSSLIQIQAPAAPEATSVVAKVSRPANTAPSATVTLFATVSLGDPANGPKTTTSFDLVVVHALTSADAVGADIASLAIGFAPADSATSVTGDLTLPLLGANGTALSWSSDPAHPAAIQVLPPATSNAASVTAKVSRPALGDPNLPVTLTATARAADGTASSTRIFPLTVLSELTDPQAVQADTASLALTFAPGDNEASVTRSFALPTEGANGTKIVWASNNQSTVNVVAPVAGAASSDATATVTRPVDAEVPVTLTATITRGSVSQTRRFYPRRVLDLDALDARRLPVVWDVTDPEDASNESVRGLVTDVVVAQVATCFGLDPRMARRLLTSTAMEGPQGPTVRTALLHNPYGEGDAIEVFFAVEFLQPQSMGTAASEALMLRLQKVVFLLSRLSVAPAEVDWATSPPGMETLNVDALPLLGVEFVAPGLYLGWRKWVTLFHLRDRFPGMERLLSQYVTNLSAVGPYSSLPFDLLSPLGEGLGASVDVDYGALATQLGMGTVDDYRNPLNLDAVVSLLGAWKTLGASTKDVNLLTQSWPEWDPTSTTPDVATQAAITARALLRAKSGPDSWNAIIKPISDTLRIKQRDALVDYLLNANGLSQVNDLYGAYLIDSQMSPAMLTSRLVQATAAVQLFVQRCLLQLETVTLTDGDRQRWEWMKNYRVWEANREVFLYPENWLYPELRDDKTETFSALESALGQGEPKDDLAVANVLNYLDQLNDISKITTYGMYLSTSGDNADTSPVHTLSVVGRSPNQPYNYYWRQCTAFGDAVQMSWTGWAKIPDITDDHVMPFVLDNDLHIAWPTITQRTEVADPTQPEVKKSYWNITLNWIRRTSRGWTKKQTSKQSMPLFPQEPPIECNTAGSDADREITFRLVPNPDAGTMTFGVFHNDATRNPEIDDSVYKTTIKPDETGQITSEFKGYAALYNTFLRYNQAGLGQNLGTVTFTIYPYEKVLGTESLPYYYATAAATTASFVFYADIFDQASNSYQTYQVLVLQVDLGAAQDDQGNPVSAFQVAFDWWSFEAAVFQLMQGNPGLNPNPDQQPPYLSGFHLVCNGKEVVNERLPSIQGTISTFSQNAILEDVISTWKLTPVGQFVLNAFADISVEPAGAAAAPRCEARYCYADGYFSYDNGSGLELPTDNAGLFSVPNITSPGWVVPAALGTPEGQFLWYFEYSPALAANPDPEYWPFKLYIYGAVTSNNSSNLLENANLEIWDNIAATAALRAAVHPRFADLYLPSKQAELQIRNFNWSNAADVHSIDNNAWSGFQSLPSSGFLPQAPFSLYNWELLCHTPMLIAEWLTKQQRFEDAQKWLHYLFNPTSPDSTPDSSGNPLPLSAQFWRFLPFRELAGGDPLRQLFNLLAQTCAQPGVTPANPDDLAQFTALIEEWKDQPFLPFLVARMPIRWVSFAWRVIFAYLDNLIAWGDQMFRQFTRESVNEAIQVYLLAAELLGPRPRSLRAEAPPAARSYRDYYQAWDDFSNAWCAVDGPVSLMLMKSTPRSPDLGGAKPGHRLPGGILKPEPLGSASEASVTLTSLGMLYFGIPANDKLTGYWDTVEDRLFKIRHCEDIEGMARELPLFAPPIDPLLLVRAAAAGLDIGTALADMAAPLLAYRFNVLVQKAHEICAEVKSLGAALLSALEKNDAEGLALLRSGQEVALLNLVTQVKQRQVDEANANIASLQQSLAIARARFAQYQNLLGKPISVDANGLPVLASVSSLRVAASAAGDEAGLGLAQYEVDQLKSLDEAHDHQEAAGIASTIAGVFHALPEFQTGWLAAYLHMGGMHLGNAANAVASLFSLLAGNATHEASRKGMLAGYQRRQDEWVFQSRLALEEMKQVNQQIIAAQIRLDLAQKELDNHLKQVDNAQTVDEFMHGKYTNQELYSWMTGQIANVYFTCYQLAYDTAKRAERAFRQELGLDGSDFVQFGYWDSLRKGLLAGDTLSLDLKRLEIAYLERNQRELEITRHISLLQLDPMALLELKETGACEIQLPEALFDLDFPGHYFRRLKSVSLSIPCVVGPYTSVNGTLTLLQHSYRKVPQPGARKADASGHPADDNRFVDSSGSVQSIATSSGQNDSGLFELNFRDERYLPFEGAGAISSWRLELSGKWKSPDGGVVNLAQFDFDTISDAILHLRYTARDAGVEFRGATISGWQKGLADAMKLAEDRGGFYRLFSLRHEFPSEWNRFTAPTDGDRAQAFSLGKERFPFFFQGSKISITGIELYGALTPPSPDNSAAPATALSTLTIAPPSDPQSPSGQPAQPLTLQQAEPLGQLIHRTVTLPSAIPVKAGQAGSGGPADWTFTASQTDRALLEDLLVVCHYSGNNASVHQPNWISNDP